MTAKQITFQILDELMPGTRFKGSYLMQMVEHETGEIHYPDTMLRYMREYRRTHGRAIVNVDKAKSIYEVRGH